MFTNTRIPANITEIYLIRHGETTLSGVGQYIGSTEVPLSEGGKQQVRLLADKLQGLHFDACYCSIMKRCQETAEIVAAPHQLEITRVTELREIDYGVWEGLNLQEMEAKTPEIFRAWKKDPGKIQAPGGESGENVLARIRPSFSWSVGVLLHYSNTPTLQKKKSFHVQIQKRKFLTAYTLYSML